MLAKLLFKPIGLLLGVVVARKVGTKAFERTWEGGRGGGVPTATTEQATWPEVLGAAAMKATIVAVTAATFNRLAAMTFRRITGFWPGEEERPPAKHLEADSE